MYTDPLGLVSFGALKKALAEVHKKMGGSLPKGKDGKWGSPQRGDSRKGYRYDNEGHPNTANPNETGPHINYWDYTKGKRGKGGEADAVPVKPGQGGFVDPGLLVGLIPFIGGLFGEGLGCSSFDCNNDGIPDNEPENEFQCP